MMQVRNFMRVMRVWMADHPVKDLFYKQALGSTTLPSEWLQFEEEMDDEDAFIDKQVFFRDKNQCQNFAWFEKHVLMKVLGTTHPWHASRKQGS